MTADPVDYLYPAGMLYKVELPVAVAVRQAVFRAA